MTPLTTNDVVALIAVALAGVCLLANVLLNRKRRNLEFKKSPTVTALLAFQHEAAEQGKRLTFGLGEGFSDRAVSIGNWLGMSVWQDAARRAVFNDHPSQAVSGSGPLVMISQMVLRGVYQDAVALELFKPEQVLLGGVSSAANMAGLLPEINQETNQAVALIGSFGPMAGLAANLSARKQLPMIGIADTLPTQATFFASTPLTTLGEDYFGAELSRSNTANASAQLQAQDWLRVAAVLALLIGALLKLTGAIP